MTAAVDSIKNVNPDVDVEACELSLFTRSGLSMVHHAVMSGTCMQPASYIYNETDGQEYDSEDSDDKSADVINCYACKKKGREKLDHQMLQQERFVSKRKYLGPFKAPTDATNAVNLLVACTESKYRSSCVKRYLRISWRKNYFCIL